MLFFINFIRTFAIHGYSFMGIILFLRSGTKLLAASYFIKFIPVLKSVFIDIQVCKKLNSL